MADDEVRAWLIRQVRLYVPVADEDAGQIVSRFSCRQINKGDYLLKEGQYGDWWGFVYRGLLRSYSYNYNEREYTNGFLREGSFTCELVSFYGTGLSPSNVVALEDTLLICVNKQTLDNLFKDYIQFEKFGRLLYEGYLAQYKQRNLFRVRLNARERYLYFLKNEPELIKRVPLKYIASYLNVTNTSLSRIRREISLIEA